MSWYELYREEVLKCTRCPARKECQAPVPGEGKIDADLVFVGRNTGETEDRAGRPFVGRAGEVFERMLMEFEIERPQIFITNLYLCKTKKNRLPSLYEVQRCVPKFLLWSLMEIKPKVIVTFGQCTNYYMNSFKKVSEVHGQPFLHRRLGAWVVPSIHPAMICYNPHLYGKLQEIMKVVDKLLHTR